MLSHHLVIRDGKIANYHPYPPTPWNGSPTDSYGTPGPYEDAVTGSRSSRRTARTTSAGIDIMRAVRSFDPCLPCGVHMYLGNGKTLKQVHSPMFGGSTADGGRDGRREARELVGRVEGCSSERRVAARPGRPRARDEPLQALLDLYGEGLRADRRAGRAAAAGRRRSPSDELVAHLLLLHGLHPVAWRSACARRSTEVRPYLDSHGGDVELLGVEDGVVRVRMQGSCEGCPRRR